MHGSHMLPYHRCTQEASAAPTARAKHKQAALQFNRYQHGKEIQEQA